MSTIMQKVRSDRQTFMFSATWPKEIQSFSNKYIKDYVYLQIGNESLTVNKNILQIIDIVPENKKGQRVVDIILQHQADKQTNNHTKILMFCRKKVRCDDMVSYLYTK